MKFTYNYNRYVKYQLLYFPQERLFKYKLICVEVWRKLSLSWYLNCGCILFTTTYWNFLQIQFLSTKDTFQKWSTSTETLVFPTLPWEIPSIPAKLMFCHCVGWPTTKKDKKFNGQLRYFDLHYLNTNKCSGRTRLID